jgi:hypothetical protein
MPLTETNTNEFVTYTQKLREAKDQYTERKVQKDRIKHVGWFNAVLSQKDIVLTYKEDGKSIQVIASKNGNGVSPLPQPPITIENVLGEDREEVHHIVFYTSPQGDTKVVHIDDVECWVITNTMMNQIDKIYKRSINV